MKVLEGLVGALRERASSEQQQYNEECEHRGENSRIEKNLVKNQKDYNDIGKQIEKFTSI